MSGASFRHAVGEFRCFFQCEHCGFGQASVPQVFVKAEPYGASMLQVTLRPSR